MGLWDINASADLIKTVASINGNSKSTFSATNSTGFSSVYAKILSEQISRLEQDAQSETENLSSQNQNDDNTPNTMAVIETVRRFRPDGSIMITTYKDGKIDSTTHIKPHLVPMPNYSAPPTPEGDPQIEMVPQFSLAQLLML